jgi:YesN/AraC family two-component response regulator
MIEAGNGDEAIAAFKESDGKFDLLLTDVIMPGMSGKVLAETLVAELPDLRVLYMSGYTDNVIAQQGVLDEGIFFVNKPLVPSTLSKKVREVLDSN